MDSLNQAANNLFDYYSNLSEAPADYSVLRDLLCQVMIKAANSEDYKVRDMAREAVIMLDCEDLELAQLHIFITFIFEELEIG